MQLSFGGVAAVHAQDDAERMNEIKLSGRYFTAEATAHDQEKAFLSAYSMLLNTINMELMEEDKPVLSSRQLESHVKSLDIQRGGDVMAFVYVERSRVAVMQGGGSDGGAPTSHNESATVRPSVPESSAAQPSPSVSSAPKAAVGGLPDVIGKLVAAQTFMTAQWLLDNAMNAGEISGYGTPQSMGDVSGCYIVVVNDDKDVVTVLSPKKDGARIDLRSGSVADMGQYKGCAPVCVRK